ncbi:MAG: hypothetical protein LBC40_07935 [Dysgonamonadaceae bacterium]|jgi:hypothetical protein|nr:hypothetical protein [Dysgonamonadaceae bacterium]
MTKKDYLPRAYDALLIWLTNFLSYVLANLSRFAIPGYSYESLQAKVTEFRTAQEKAENPNAGKADKLVRTEKAADVRKATRSFVNQYLRYNPAVTDEDRVKLGLTVPDPAPTPAPLPVTWPVVRRIDSGTIMRLKLIYRDSQTADSRAKPDHTNGAEICYVIRDTPPTSTDDLIHSVFSTHSPYTFIFDEPQRGKTIWFRLRWENTRGQKGPWSELYSAIIP